METIENEDEQRRLAALERTGLLDTAPEEVYDRYARIAATIAGTPMALVSLVDECRQWFKAKLGLTEQETPRQIAFCAHAIRSDEIMIVPDAQEDARFADNPLVTGGPKIAFYAGAPIRLDGGERIGTLCVLDTVPRELQPAQVDALRDLAAMLSREIGWRSMATTAFDHAAALIRERDIATAQADASKLVAREMNHRMGNLFAQVTGLVSLAEREHENRHEFVTAVKDRVIALKSVSDILVRQSWDGAELSEIAAASLAAIHGGPDTAGRVSITGPDLIVNERAALHFALVFSELAANALRHGALTADGGTAALSWSDDGETLTVDWSENGMSGVAQPSREGFGSVLLTKVAPAGLMGVAERSFEPTGFSYRLTASLPHIAPLPTDAAATS